MIGYSRVGGDNFYFNLASGMGTLLSNIGLGICSGTIFVKKLINVIHARCKNMTEDEYYKKVIEPIVTEKLAKQRKLKKEAKENYKREKQRERDCIEQYRNELESENKSDDPQSDLL